MKRFLPGIAGAGGFSVAAAILTVGLVTAVTSAKPDTSTVGSSVVVTTDEPTDDTEVAPPEEGEPTTPDERLDAVEARLDDLEGLTASLSDRTGSLETATERINGVLDQLRATVKDLRTDITSYGARIDGLVASVEAIVAKTSRLNADGTYTGQVDPSQLSRKLTPADVNGQWPLDRTTGTLDIARLGTPTFGCYGDSRYNVFMGVDVFGKYTCIKVLK